MKKFLLRVLHFARRIYKLIPIPKKLRMFISKHFLSKIVWMNHLLFPQYIYFNRWIIENGYDNEGLEKQRNHRFENEPLISIAVPMYNPRFEHVEELIDSIKNQTYINWELCIADGSTTRDVKIEALCLSDNRIKYISLDGNKGIAGNTNEAIKKATGKYIGLIDHDDFLPPFSLYEIVKFINENPEAELIYTDETHYHKKRKKSFHNPHIKPDFSPDYLRTVNFICHFMIIKRSLFDKVGMLRSECDGSQDFDFALRASEVVSKVYHIPKFLYHWRIHNESFSNSEITPSRLAGKKAIEDQLIRLGLKGKVKLPKDNVFYNVEYEVIGNPSVSIIIPNKDHIKLLKKCIKSIILLTTYKNYEIVIIENNSEQDKTFNYYRQLEKAHKNIRVLIYPEQGFNYSKLINYGVRNSSSDFIVQLNNDTVLRTPNWLELMIGFAQRDDVGAVGAKMYYPDMSVQHAGVAVWHDGYICYPIFLNLQFSNPGYMHRVNCIQNHSIITGACLMCRRELYEKVGFMDENYSTAYNDADLCMKFRKMGLVNVYNPCVEFIHYESKTRGYEDTPEKKARFQKESDFFRKRWREEIELGDPYFPNDISKMR